MGLQNSKPEPKKSDEEIMRERWANLAQSNIRPVVPVNIVNQSEKKKSLTEGINPSDKRENCDEIKNEEKIEKTQETSKIIVDVINKSELVPSIDIEKGDSNLNNQPDNKTSEQSQNKPIIIEPKKLDKEHSTIEKIFRISLIPSEKFIHLALYQAQLISDNQEEAFRLNDLDNIIMAIISEGGKKEKIVSYLLETYHRAIEMIEKRYKNEYDDTYLQIRRMIASYLALIIYAPENFEIKLVKQDTLIILSDYFTDTDIFEVEYLIGDIIQSTSEDFYFMQQVFSYVLNVIQMDNLFPKNNFFNQDKMKKNLNILLKILNDYPVTREAYVMEPNFIPKGVSAKVFQNTSMIGVYLNLVSFEADSHSIKCSFPSLVNNDSDVNIRTFVNKLNSMLNEVTSLFVLLLENTKSRNHMMQYLFDIVNLNLERKKMYSNPYLVSSIGFLLNTVIVLLKIFFEFENKNHTIFEIVADIDILYATTSNELPFAKNDRINEDDAKTILNSSNFASESFNQTTKLFFTIHNMLSYFIKNLDEEYTKLAQQLSNMFKMNLVNDPRFKELLAMLKSIDIYIRNPEFHKNIMKFNEISCLVLFCLNNQKYSCNKSNLEYLKSVDVFTFLDDFFENIEIGNLDKLSVLPNHLIKNIISSSLLLRKFYSEAILTDLTPTKIIIYFSITYSSQVNLIRNPHLRSEIFDILFYFFNTSQQERNAKQITNLNKLLGDEFIKNHMIYSLIRVFIDAERLGTSNQFYEKFSIRHKILTLLDNIMKSGNRYIYSEKFIEVANKEKFDTTKMINLLMNDVTYLIDECIERLIAIKRYQDIKDDIASYNQLDQETKQMEEERFRENDYRVKPELQLLNSSMNFMVTISSFCQENFMSYKLSERLANLLNYSLDVFTSKKNLKLKVK